MTKITSTKLRQRIIFRADGNSRIGLGHVTRSLALAHMLRDEYECIFAIQSPDAALQEQILSVCHGNILLPACTTTEERFKHELDAYISAEEIVVLDGYNFTTAYQQNIKARGAVLVCLDDIHAFPFVADVVINQAGGVDASLYTLAPYTKLYLGPAFALLRPPFLKNIEETEPKQEDFFHVLLCMGGADPDNHTLTIADEIHQQHSGVYLEIVVGSANKHSQSLNTWLKKHTQHKLYTNLCAEGMAALMRKCSVAVTSASGVSYEYAAVGGALFVLKTADNQEALYQYLLSSGLAESHNSFTEKLNHPNFSNTIKTCKEKQKQVFDGKSDERLKTVFASLQLQTSLKIRPVVPDDLALLFNWANDPEVRKNSFNTASIPLEIHTNWFNSKVDNPGSKLFVAEVRGRPAAHIRFELSDHTAVISYLISKEFRGKGLGHDVLRKGVNELLKGNDTIKQVEGLVQKSNIASVRAFEKAGFEKSTPDDFFPDAYRFTFQVHPNNLNRS